jgi:hypothetical protein
VPGCGNFIRRLLRRTLVRLELYLTFLKATNFHWLFRQSNIAKKIRNKKAQAAGSLYFLVSKILVFGRKVRKVRKESKGNIKC